MSTGFVHCWKCGDTLDAGTEANDIPVVALTVDVVLCDDCAVELADRTEDAAPSVEDLSAWRYPDELFAEATTHTKGSRHQGCDNYDLDGVCKGVWQPPLKLGMTVRDIATGEVLATLGTAAATGGGNT